MARSQNGFPLGYPVLTLELQHRVGAAEPGANRFGEHCQSPSSGAAGAWLREVRLRPGGRYSRRQHLCPADTGVPETLAPRRHRRPETPAFHRHLRPADTYAPPTPTPHPAGSTRVRLTLPRAGLASPFFAHAFQRRVTGASQQ